MVQAILWDFGGVITTSPFERFAQYELEKGFPENTIRGINATNPDKNAWALFERNEIDAETFDTTFYEEAKALGFDIPGRDILPLIAGEVRPEMLDALKRCKENFKIGCITNDMRGGPNQFNSNVAAGEKRREKFRDVMKLFDEVIYSSKVGIRKPDPRIYEMACEALNVSPNDCVFLDDIGSNLKPAREMGMQTIKVVDPAKALAELENIIGISLS